MVKIKKFREIVVFFSIIIYLCQKLIKWGLSVFILLLLMGFVQNKLQANTLVQDLQDIKRGSLLIKNSAGYYTEIPLLDTQVIFAVKGIINRASIKQFFENQSADYIEAIYVFPLPENSAVDHMSVLIGERRIVGQIKKKDVAKKIYEKAKAKGQKTALLKQNKANIFTTKIANIAPGEVIEVNIEYQQSIEYKSGEFAFRFPTTITPQYQPILSDNIINQGGASQFKENQSSEADLAVTTINSRVMDEGIDHSLNIDVDLDSDFALTEITSPYHPVVIHQLAKGQYQIRLQNYHKSDRDFELRWKPEPSEKPQLAVFNEIQDKEHYLMLMLVPPKQNYQQQLQRDFTIVIDQSGSMLGQSMAQAKIAIDTALKRLNQGDKFNIIAFNDRTFSLFHNPVDVTPHNIKIARQFIQSLKANNGTEMLPALHRALTESMSSGVVRQVVFITDGAVSNEKDLFREINQSLGEARLFTIGIGSAPNSYFMRKAAEFGRGSFTHIGNSSEVSTKMQKLFEQLENPVMNNIQLNWPVEVEQYPPAIPDLYQGQPLIVKAKAQEMIFSGDVQISGVQGNLNWHTSVELDAEQSVFTEHRPANGVAKLWARAKISALHDKQIIEPQNQNIKDELTEVALKHHLVSRYTSLVAVEQKPSRARENTLLTQKVPSHRPKGSQTVFSYPKTALGIKDNLFSALLLIIVSLLLFFAYSRYKAQGLTS